MTEVAPPTVLLGNGDLFSETARTRPDRLALAHGTDRRTYAEVDRESNQLARALAEQGVEAGRLVAIALENSPLFVELVLACWKLGAVPFPLSFRLPEREFGELRELATPALCIGRFGVDAGDVVARAAALDASSMPATPTDPYLAIGTGGSTGRPKLILKPGSPPDRVRAAATAWLMEPDVPHLLAGPLYHSGPFIWSMLHFVTGGPLVLMERFEAAAFLDLLEAERVGWAFVVPTMLHRMTELPEEVRAGRTFPDLRVLLHAAAPCPPWLKRKAIELFGAERVYEAYGATEVEGTVIRGDEWLAHPGSVGRPTTVHVEIRDDDGRPLPPGEVGEIWIKPSGRLRFAYRGAEANVAGGFVSVGDMGWLDAEGYLYIADRRTDMIISGGSNVYPAEVEAALLEHPAVRDVAVIGLRNDEWGRRVHAIVSVDDPTAVSTEELDAHCRERLLPYKVPRSWELVDTVLRDPSGKIRRSALQAEREGAASP